MRLALLSDTGGYSDSDADGPSSFGDDAGPIG